MPCPVCRTTITTIGSCPHCRRPIPSLAADRAVIQAHQVTMRYGKKHTEVVAVNNLSLEIGRGEIALVMGPSGSGKTTLLQLLGCLLRPSAGRILLHGTDVSSLSARALPRFRLLHLGFVFQDFNLLASLTALENVQVPLGLAGVRPAVARERATALLTELGISERLGHAPAQLSGGEQQRVAIARALALGPELILADEPTANLDSKSGAQVMEQFQRMVKAEGRSLVIVSHDPRLREISDRVFWLEDGAFRDIAVSNMPHNAPPVAAPSRPVAVPHERPALAPAAESLSAQRALAPVRVLADGVGQQQEAIRAANPIPERGQYRAQPPSSAEAIGTLQLLRPSAAAAADPAGARLPRTSEFPLHRPTAGAEVRARWGGEDLAGLAMDGDGRMYAACEGGRVLRFDPAGRPLARLMRPGNPDGHFARPRLAVNGAGQVYVADSGRYILKFAPDGRCLTWWDAGGGGPIATAPDGDIYLADAATRTIRRYSGDGYLLAQWEAVVNGQGCADVTDLAVDEAGRVYAAREDGRVLRFDAVGGPLAELVRPGSPTGRFGCPHLAADRAGHVYVVDSGRYLLKFAVDGRCLNWRDTGGSADGHGTVVALATAASGDVYLADKATTTIRRLL